MLPCGKVPRAVVYSGVEGNNGILGNGPQLLRLRLQCGRFWSFCWHPLFFGCKHFMITMNIERYGLGDLNSVSSIHHVVKSMLRDRAKGVSGVSVLSIFMAAHLLPKPLLVLLHPHPHPTNPPLPLMKYRPTPPTPWWANL